MSSDNECIGKYANTANYDDHSLPGEWLTLDGENVFPCEVCHQVFTRKQLPIHMRKHSKETLIKTLLILSDATTNETKALVETGSCNLAEDKHDTVFRNRTGKNCFPCQFCGKILRRKEELLVHMRIHIEEKPHVCNGCRKQFSQKKSLQRHQMLHKECTALVISDNCMDPQDEDSENVINQGSVNIFSCDKCDQVFAHKNNLCRHKRSHDKNYNCLYSCEVCGKQLKRKRQLMIHMRMHSNEKPYKCKGCGKEFSQKKNVSRHQSLHIECRDTGFFYEELASSGILVAKEAVSGVPKSENNEIAKFVAEFQPEENQERFPSEDQNGFQHNGNRSIQVSCKGAGLHQPDFPATDLSYPHFVQATDHSTINNASVEHAKVQSTINSASEEQNGIDHTTINSSSEEQHATDQSISSVSEEQNGTDHTRLNSVGEEQHHTEHNSSGQSLPAIHVTQTQRGFPRLHYNGSQYRQKKPGSDNHWRCCSCNKGHIYVVKNDGMLNILREGPHDDHNTYKPNARRDEVRTVLRNIHSDCGRNKTISNVRDVDTDAVVHVTFTVNKRGTSSLGYSGYLYNFEQITGEVHVWKCRISGCKGEVLTDHVFMPSKIKLQTLHTHPAVYGGPKSIAKKKPTKPSL